MGDRWRRHLRFGLSRRLNSDLSSTSALFLCCFGFWFSGYSSVSEFHVPLLAAVLLLLFLGLDRAVHRNRKLEYGCGRVS